MSAMNVLVVDDDPIFRSLIQSRLVRLECACIEATDGAQAWQLTRTHHLDLAVVDFDMPGLDGIALIRCLRGHPAMQHIPIVMCTSHTDPHAMQAALEAGASAFLTKPVNWPLFEKHIAHLLQLGQAAAGMHKGIEQAIGLSKDKDALVAGLVTDLEDLLRPGAASAQCIRTAGELLKTFVASYDAVSVRQGQGSLRGDGAAGQLKQTA